MLILNKLNEKIKELFCVSDDKEDFDYENIINQLKGLSSGDIIYADMLLLEKDLEVVPIGHRHRPHLVVNICDDHIECFPLTGTNNGQIDYCILKEKYDKLYKDSYLMLDGLVDIYPEQYKNYMFSLEKEELEELSRKIYLYNKIKICDFSYKIGDIIIDKNNHLHSYLIYDIKDNDIYCYEMLPNYCHEIGINSIYKISGQKRKYYTDFNKKVFKKNNSKLSLKEECCKDDFDTIIKKAKIIEIKKDFKDFIYKNKKYKGNNILTNYDDLNYVIIRNTKNNICCLELDYLKNNREIINFINDEIDSCEQIYNLYKKLLDNIVFLELDYLFANNLYYESFDTYKKILLLLNEEKISNTEYSVGKIVCDGNKFYYIYNIGIKNIYAYELFNSKVSEDNIDITISGEEYFTNFETKTFYVGEKMIYIDIATEKEKKDIDTAANVSKIFTNMSCKKQENKDTTKLFEYGDIVEDRFGAKKTILFIKNKSVYCSDLVELIPVQYNFNEIKIVGKLNEKDYLILLKKVYEKGYYMNEIEDSVNKCIVDSKIDKQLIKKLLKEE